MTQYHFVSSYFNLRNVTGTSGAYEELNQNWDQVTEQNWL